MEKNGQREVKQIDISRNNSRPPIRQNTPHRMDGYNGTSAGQHRDANGSAGSRTGNGSDRPPVRRAEGTGSRTGSDRPPVRRAEGTGNGSGRPPVRRPASQQTGYSRPATSSARNSRKGRRRRRRRNSGIKVFLVLLALILVGMVGVLYARVKTDYTLEAGNLVDPGALVRYGSKVPQVVQGLTEEQTRTPGDYGITVKMSPFTYKVQVKVADTIAPAAQTQEVYGLYGQALEPTAFLTEITDGTDVTVTYEKEPDYQAAGTQNVGLVLTDEGGNVTRLGASLYISNLKTELVLEAGSSMPGADAFLEEIPGFEGTEISYVTDPATVDTTALGSQEIVMSIDGKEVTTKLTIQDTIPPVIRVKTIDGWTGKAIPAEDFVQELNEATEVTYAYVQEPDWTKEGSGSAEIVVTDAAGNTVQETVSYTLKKDTVAPEVSLSTIDIIIGEAVSYKKAVGYSDNCDSKDELKLDIDNSKVDPNTEGEYEVTYTVTDTAGNSTTKTGKVYVLAEKPIYYDEDVVNQKADEVLAGILKDDMTQLEKARAIYNWVHSHIGYINHSEKGDWVRGAYEGLVKRQGDCFVYASTSKVLLTRAGINNMDIVKSTVNPSHYWNLVDVGDGWYHFDATPRKDKTVFFMWTDEQLREYSESHKNTHIYDASLYPEIN